MKKVMFLMAVAGMFAFAACNNTTAPKAETDSLTSAITENQVDEPIVDSPAEVTMTEEGAEPIAE